jgi:hypothetical protein
MTFGLFLSSPSLHHLDADQCQRFGATYYAATYRDCNEVLMLRDANGKPTKPAKPLAMLLSRLPAEPTVTTKSADAGAGDAIPKRSAAFQRCTGFPFLLMLWLLYQELRAHTRQQKVICEAAIRFIEMTNKKSVGLSRQIAAWPYWVDEDAESS